MQVWFAEESATWDFLIWQIYWAVVMIKIEANNGQPYILTALLGTGYTGALLDMVEVIFVRCHYL